MSLPGGVIEDRISYWREVLRGAPTKLELPTDRPRPAIQGAGRATESFRLPDELLTQLKALGQSEQATSFMTLAAGFVVLLNRYTAQDDILMASPIRDNLVVLRARLNDDLDFRSLLRQIRDRVLGANADGDLTFERLVSELVSEPDPSHAPLCQVMFVHDGTGAAPERSAPRTPEYDLTLRVTETSSGLDASIAYSTDLFEAETIRRLCGHYGSLLESIVRDPDRGVRTLQMLTEQERDRVLYHWNDTAAPIPAVCAHRLFEEQVARTPDATAIVFEDAKLTYRELNQRANRLARHLCTLGVGPEVLVGVCLGRSIELAVALLAVWKTGGAYVPLDSTLPQQRLAYMLRDASAKVLVTDEALLASFDSDRPTAVRIDADWPTIEIETAANLDTPVAPSNLAYVMYTSGSTGQPKGVMILHSGLVNYLSWAKDKYAAGSGGAVPVHSSIAFDLTVTALYAPLVAGGRIEMLREDLGAQNLTAAMRRGEDRSLVKITPAHLALLSEQLGAQGVAGRTKLFVIGGENLTAESLLLWRDHAPETRLINEYGPTETVVGCCVHEVSATDPRTGNVPIGRPIANTQLYILDRHMNPLPPGIVGELYIGGAGVARGYLNLPDLTRERFLPDPFSKESGARIYKTGDLARYRADGVLEYFGRADSQVKVRGYRIELGEIEAVLADLPGVKSCAVLAREDVPGNKQLVGYVCRSTDVHASGEELRRSLRQSLPEYMVPSQLLFLEAMPLTTNGKVDRKALPPPWSDAPSTQQNLVAARTPNEQKLVAIWEEILGLSEIGVHDNFFEIGGHSLQAMKAVTRMEEVFEVEVSPQALFEAPTIAQLAELFGDVPWTPTWTNLVPIQTEGTRPPFFLVHALGGNVFNYRLLSKHMGTEQPFYGMQARGITGNDPPHESIEETARDYLLEIRQLQPSGPYRLGGASSGGAIAYEMAQQLLAIGERVSVVVMLDTVRPGPPPKRIVDALADSEKRRLRMRLDFHLGALMNRSPRQAYEYIAELVRWRRSGPEGQIAAAIKAESPKLAHVIARNRVALAAYEPRPYPGKVVMLMSGDEPDRSAFDRRLAWADLLTDGLTVHFCPGDHENMLLEPYVGPVSVLLTQCLR